jgi:hypothetical protein
MDSLENDTFFVYHENPSARGAYMLRNFVCVGFHSSPGEACIMIELSPFLLFYFYFV